MADCFPNGTSAVPLLFQRREQDQPDTQAFKLIFQLERARFLGEDAKELEKSLAEMGVRCDEVRQHFQEMLPLASKATQLQATPEHIAMFFSGYDDSVFADFIQLNAEMPAKDGVVHLDTCLEDLAYVYIGLQQHSGRLQAFEYFERLFTSTPALINEACFTFQFAIYIANLITTKDCPLQEQGKTKEPELSESRAIYSFLQKCFDGTRFRATISDVKALEEVILNRVVQHDAFTFCVLANQRSFERFCVELVGYLYENRVLSVSLKPAKKQVQQPLQLLGLLQELKSGQKLELQKATHGQQSQALDLQLACLPNKLYPEMQRAAADPLLKFVQGCMDALFDKPGAVQELADLLQIPAVSGSFQDAEEVAAVLRQPKVNKHAISSIYLQQLHNYDLVSLQSSTPDIQGAFGTPETTQRFAQQILTQKSTQGQKQTLFEIPVRMYLLLVAILQCDAQIEPGMQRLRRLHLKVVQMCDRVCLRGQPSIQQLKQSLQLSNAALELRDPSGSIIQSSQRENTQLSQESAQQRLTIRNLEAELASYREITKLQHVMEADEMVRIRQLNAASMEAIGNIVRAHSEQNMQLRAHLQQLSKVTADERFQAVAAECQALRLEIQNLKSQKSQEELQNANADLQQRLAEQQAIVDRLQTANAGLQQQMQSAAPQQQAQSAPAPPTLSPAKLVHLQTSVKPVAQAVRAKLQENGPENQARVAAFVLANTTIDNLEQLPAVEPTPTQINKIFLSFKNAEALRFLTQQDIRFQTSAVLSDFQLQRAILVFIANNYTLMHSALGLKREEIVWLLRNDKFVDANGCMTQ